MAEISAVRKVQPRLSTATVTRLGLAIVLLAATSQTAFAQKSAAVEAITTALRARDFAEAAERSRAALQKAPNDRAAVDPQRHWRSRARASAPRRSSRFSAR